VGKIQAIQRVAKAIGVRHLSRQFTRMETNMADDAAHYPKYIPVRHLKAAPYYGPGVTKAYALIGEGKLDAVRTPWGTMVTGASFARLMASYATAGCNGDYQRR
jgi:hypothetical protein